MRKFARSEPRSGGASQSVLIVKVHLTTQISYALDFHATLANHSGGPDRDGTAPSFDRPAPGQGPVQLAASAGPGPDRRRRRQPESDRRASSASMFAASPTTCVCCASWAASSWPKRSSAAARSNTSTGSRTGLLEKRLEGAGDADDDVVDARLRALGDLGRADREARARPVRSPAPSSVTSATSLPPTKASSWQLPFSSPVGHVEGLQAQLVRFVDAADARHVLLDVRGTRSLPSARILRSCALRCSGKTASW